MNNILFDLDGTLTNSHEGITKCVQYALSFFDIHVEDLNSLDVFIGPPLIESFMKFYRLSKEDAMKGVEKYRERFSTVGLFENEVFDGVEGMLEELKKSGKNLYIASSKPEVFVVRILEHYKLDKYFNEMVGATLDGKRAEKSDVIKEVIKRANLDPSDCLMVGDRMHDIVGAKECKMKSIGVNFGFAPKGELEEYGADYIVDSMEELKELIIKL